MRRIDGRTDGRRMKHEEKGEMIGTHFLNPSVRSSVVLSDPFQRLVISFLIISANPQPLRNRISWTVHQKQTTSSLSAALRPPRAVREDFSSLETVVCRIGVEQKSDGSTHFCQLDLRPAEVPTIPRDHDFTLRADKAKDSSKRIKKEKEMKKKDKSADGEWNERFSLKKNMKGFPDFLFKTQ